METRRVPRFWLVLIIGMPLLSLVISLWGGR